MTDKFTEKEYVSKCCAYFVYFYKKQEGNYVGFCGRCGKKLTEDEIRIHKEEKYKPLLTRLIEKDENFHLYLFQGQLKEFWNEHRWKRKPLIWLKEVIEKSLAKEEG